MRSEMGRGACQASIYINEADRPVPWTFSFAIMIASTDGKQFSASRSGEGGNMDTDRFVVISG
jgi:hypothetical protein